MPDIFLWRKVFCATGLKITLLPSDKISQAKQQRSSKSHARRPVSIFSAWLKTQQRIVGMDETRHKTGHSACTNLPKIQLKGKELSFGRKKKRLVQLSLPLCLNDLNRSSITGLTVHEKWVGEWWRRSWEDDVSSSSFIMLRLNAPLHWSWTGQSPSLARLHSQRAANVCFSLIRAIHSSCLSYPPFTSSISLYSASHFHCLFTCRLLPSLQNTSPLHFSRGLRW